MPITKCACCKELEPLLAMLEEVKTNPLADRNSIINNVEAHIQNVLGTCDREQAGGKIYITARIDINPDGGASFVPLAWSHNPDAAKKYKGAAETVINPVNQAVDVFEAPKEVG